MRYVRFSIWPAPVLMLMVSGLTALGCEKLEAERAERQGALDGRAEITAYAERVPTTYAKQEAWVSAIGKLRTATTPAAITALTVKEIAPTLDGYAAELQGVAPVPAALAPAHTGLVAAHNALAQAFRDFADGLDRKNYTARREALVRAAAVFNDAQRAYVTTASEHYRRFEVDLAPAPPVTLTL